MNKMSVCRLSDYGNVIAGLDAAIFCGGLDEAALPRLTLHVGDDVDIRATRRDLQAGLALHGLAADCRIKRHSGRALDSAMSLEALLRLVGGEKIVFDPTGSFIAARRLLAASQSLRKALDGQGIAVRGFYFDAVNTSFYIVLDTANGSVADERRGQVEAIVRRALGPSLPLRSIMIGVDLPSTDCAAVDEASALAAGLGANDRAGLFRRLSAAMAVLTGLTLAGQASAQQPAVSAVNGKASILGGWVDDRATGRVDGSLTVPIGTSFGVQADARGGIEGSKGVWGVGGHLFWRDPARALFGLNVNWSERGNHNTLGRAGPEAELYMNAFTLAGRGGYQFGTAKNGIFGQAEIRWYVVDDLMLAAGGEIAPGTNYLGRGRAEFQPALAALPGLSVFAEGDVGNRDYWRAVAGVRLYFGQAKSLKRRHREDDPVSGLDGDAGSARQEQVRRAYGH